MLPFLIPAVTAAFGIGQSLLAGQKQKEEEAKLKAAIANRPTFKPSDYIKNMVADAKSRQNAESPAVRQAYEQVRQQAADTAANAEINAVSGGQALGAAAIAQQQMQSATPQLAAQQEAYHQANLNRADQASQSMAQQEAMAHEDAISKHNDLVNMYLGKVAAANQNKAMGLSAAIQGGLAAASSIGDNAQNKDLNVYSGKPMNFNLQTPQRMALPTVQPPATNGLRIPMSGFTAPTNYAMSTSVNPPAYNPFFATPSFNPFFNSATFKS